MNFSSLSIRGILGGGKSMWVKELRLNNNIGEIALQESKLESVSRANLVGFWGNNSFEFCYTGSVGLSGGLIWMWDPDSINIEVFVQNRCFLIIRGTLSGNGPVINMVNVYAPQNTEAKCQLWNELSILIRSYEGKWILTGDFNAVRFIEERKNSYFKAVYAENFDKFIFDNGLQEYPLQGCQFTCIRDNGRKLSKLDRFLVCSEFFNAWPLACARVLPGRHSDHCPIILEVIDHNFGPRPFRIFSSWISQPGFEEAVTEANDSFVSDAKEKENVNVALSELETLEMEMENRDLAEEEEWIMAENKKVIKEVDLRKNADLRQRSRLKWALDGDENSKLFHAMVNNRKAVNSIRGLTINDEWCTKPKLIKKEVLTFFIDKFKESVPNRPKLVC
ncbi:uncharacterized protein LOC110893239 [Helianthus annuus]|uniref:uncharacterized protein LOC110893239 n=1 Tax=Helianthus annuus TaxID=4232 RepID=UPI000B8F0983|nr:uncharacterized protein LOC110893239 [Helianthus annuus]